MTLDLVDAAPSLPPILLRANFWRSSAGFSPYLPPPHCRVVGISSTSPSPCWIRLEETTSSQTCGYHEGDAHAVLHRIDPTSCTSTPTMNFEIVKRFGSSRVCRSDLTLASHKFNLLGFHPLLRRNFFVFHAANHLDVEELVFMCS